MCQAIGAKSLTTNDQGVWQDVGVKSPTTDVAARCRLARRHGDRGKH